jgi:hypothetical protein
VPIEKSTAIFQTIDDCGKKVRVSKLVHKLQMLEQRTNRKLEETSDVYK